MRVGIILDSPTGWSLDRRTSARANFRLFHPFPRRTFVVSGKLAF